MRLRKGTNHEVKDYRSEQAESDEGERSPKPVGAMGADVEGGIGRVEVQSVVAHSCYWSSSRCGKEIRMK